MLFHKRLGEGVTGGYQFYCKSIQYISISKSFCVARTHWHFQCPLTEPPAFAAMGKLQKHGHKSTKMVTWKTDVVVTKPQILEDCNNLRLYHNGEKAVDKSRRGVLPFLLFTMSTPTSF